jgi:two-component system sensor histidine kinase PilS (NtrC family)
VTAQADGVGVVSRLGMLADEPVPASFWRSLTWFNSYRLLLAVLLCAAAGFATRTPLIALADRGLFVATTLAWAAFALLCFAALAWRRPEFQLQIALQVCGDIVFVALLLRATGGLSNGFGLLLLANLAAAGIISRGRLTLFYASLASVTVLLVQTWDILFDEGTYGQYLQAGFLCIGYFATAWLAHALAKRALASEELAEQRGMDLAGMERINRLVIQDMQDGVIVVDGGGVVRAANARAEELFGPLPAGRVVRLADYNEGLAARLARWYRDPDAGSDPLRTIITKRTTAARFVPVPTAGGQGAVIFVEDLTRVQQQAQQLKLASLGRLTANIAHEIRNPLSAINHATELLQEEVDFDDGQRRLLAIIHDNVQRLDAIVQDVLRLNRRDRAVREVFDVTDYLTTFASQFGQIEKIDPTVIALAIDGRPRVAFDKSHLNQVMWNLCRNALRYCRREAGSVRIAVVPGTVAGTFELSVIDDGAGIDEDTRGHLFEPFFTTASTGTGLGLYLAREICEANGATLAYVERASGTQFTLVAKAA